MFVDFIPSGIGAAYSGGEAGAVAVLKLDGFRSVGRQQFYTGVDGIDGFHEGVVHFEVCL